MDTWNNTNSDNQTPSAPAGSGPQPNDSLGQNQGIASPMGVPTANSMSDNVNPASASTPSMSSLSNNTSNATPNTSTPFTPGVPDFTTPATNVNTPTGFNDNPASSMSANTGNIANSAVNGGPSMANQSANAMPSSNYSTGYNSSATSTPGSLNPTMGGAMPNMQMQTSQAPSMAPVQPAQPKKSHKTLFIFLGILAVLLVVGAIIVIVNVASSVDANKNTQSSQDQTSQDSGQGQQDQKLDEPQPAPTGEGGTLTISNASLAYPDTWFEMETNDPDLITVVDNEGTDSVSLGVIQVEEPMALDEFAQVMVDHYGTEGYILVESLSYQDINGITWKHAKLSNDSIWHDFWFYVDGDQYYIMIYLNYTEAGGITDKGQAVIDSVKIDKTE